MRAIKEAFCDVELLGDSAASPSLVGVQLGSGAYLLAVLWAAVIDAIDSVVA
jgi:hypothetical protein